MIDNIVGTSGDDLIIGDNNTSAADQINGGAGTDTLKLVATTTKPQFSGIEIIQLVAPAGDFSVAANSTVTKLIVDTEAMAADRTYTIAAGQEVSLRSITGTANEFIIAAASSVTSNTVTVDKVGDTATGGTAGEIEIAGTGVTTLNLKTENNASRISLVDDNTTGDLALSTITITGDKALTINAIAASTASKVTISAAALTGALDVNLSANEVFDVTGTTGNDRFAFGAQLATTDKVTGNGGTDTVAASTAAAFTTGLSLTGINTLEVSTATTGGETLALANVSGAKDVYLSDVAGGIANGQNFTITGMATGATVRYETDEDADAGTVTFTLATATGTSDTLNLSMRGNDTGSAAAIGTLVVTGWETLNLNSTRATGQSDVAGAHTITAMTGANLQTFNITGDTSVEVTANTGAVNLTLLDGSAATGGIILGTTGAALIHAADAATFKTGSGNDKVYFDTASDAILGIDAGSQSSTGADTLYVYGTQGTGTMKIDLSSSTDQITQINGGANTGVKQIGFESVISTLATNGLDIVGSSGKNTITGSNGVKDLIRGGAGADTIDLGTTGTADTVIYDLSADIASGTTLANADTIAKFSETTAGADKINIGGVTLKAGDGTTLTTTLGTSSDGTFTTNAKNLDGGTEDLTADGTFVVRDTAAGATGAFATQANIDQYINDLVANKANITTAAGTKILIAVDGTTSNTFALFLYDEGDYDAGIQASEMSLIGVFTGKTFATDVVAGTFI